MKPANFRERIERFNGTLNAFVDVVPKNDVSGLAWGVKSNIAVAGLPLTAGIGAYAGNLAVEDAEVVRRIRQSGGDVVGTLNMHEGALGATTDNPAFGRTGNPWKEGFTPGGSSGGSGAAVAARLCDVALGTDTMGSVRIPAAYCGVQGHKPTLGIVPSKGCIDLSPTLDHIGPLAPDIARLWQAMHVLADWGQSPILEPLTLSGLRVGVWDGDGAVLAEMDVAERLNEVSEQLTSAGAKIVPLAPPAYDYSRSRRAGLLVSEIEAARVHGLTSQHQSLPGFSETFAEMMKWALRQPAEKVSAAYAHIDCVRNAAAAVWNEADFVLAPTAPQTSFRFADTVPANQADFTAWANFSGLPATAIFAGLSPAGLPLSVQIVGPANADRELLRIAAALEEILGKPPVPPDYE